MNLEERTQHLGRELLSESKRRIPPLWSEGGQKNAFFDLCMHDPEAATEIFRFMDVFPTLSNEKVLSHVREYLLDSGVNLGVLRPVVSSAGIAPEKAVAAIHFFAGKMARSFIPGSDLPEALRIVGDREATFDLLGEVTTSREDAQVYRRAYHTALEILREKQGP